MLSKCRIANSSRPKVIVMLSSERGTHCVSQESCVSAVWLKLGNGRACPELLALVLSLITNQRAGELTNIGVPRADG
eukprot:3659065-Amphidinium_carterae.1